VWKNKSSKDASATVSGRPCEYLSNYRNPPRKAGPFLHYGNPGSDNREDDERK
jgi:hypothetical protein